jgi:small subunit ribosomal protein S2
MTKKELLQLRRERDKLERSLGGIRDMSRIPSAIWVVDTKKEHIAISEARKLGIPVVAILDTNCDPDEVNYPIPGNDDAIRSVALLTRVVADAVADGLIARAGRAAGEEKPTGDGLIGAEEPLAEWERDLLEGRSVDGDPAANGATANGVAASIDASTGATGVHAAAASEADVKEAEKTEVGVELTTDGEAASDAATEAATTEAATTEAATTEAAATEDAATEDAATE